MSTLRIRSVLAFAALALSTAAGCAPALHIATPPGFAEIAEHDGYRYRASNAEGVVLAVRREKNDPAADLSFWSGAVDARLRRAGYNALEARAVEAHGLKGRQIRYAIVREGREHAYWVSVFVTRDAVVTVEAGGDKELFAHQEPAIEQAIASLDLG